MAVLVIAVAVSNLDQFNQKIVFILLLFLNLRLSPIINKVRKINHNKNDLNL